MAIYDFGGSSDTQALRALFALSSSLTSAKTAAGNIDLMTVNGQNNNGDQDTGFNHHPARHQQAPSARPAPACPVRRKSTCSSCPTASPTNRIPVPQTEIGYLSLPGRPIRSVALHHDQESRRQIAVLYTTYLALPTNAWYNSWIAPFNTGPYGPSPNSEIALNMASCASPGLYFEVSPTQGISQAMTTLFQKAVADRAHQQLSSCHSRSLDRHPEEPRAPCAASRRTTARLSHPSRLALRCRCTAGFAPQDDDRARRSGSIIAVDRGHIPW